LDLTTRETAVDDIGRERAIAGGLRGFGDAAKSSARVQQGFAAVEIFDVE
jgi:hypothetical protein